MRKYLVGGKVRDELLGRPSRDLDYAVEGPASFEEMCELLTGEGYQIFTANPQFFTARAVKDRIGSDFVLCRKESVYRDGRHPDSVTVGTIHDDLARRDFTINAIARAEDGTEIDPFEGRVDIQRKLIRCVGSVVRLREDGLRVVRALRFALILGFDLDPTLHHSLLDPSIIDCLTGVHSFRIVNELNKMFEFDVVQTLKLLSEYPILRDYLLGQVRLKASVHGSKK